MSRAPGFYTLIRTPANPEVVYATGIQGTWRSVDDGQTYEQRPTPRPHISLVVDPGSPAGLYATCQGDPSGTATTAATPGRGLRLKPERLVRLFAQFQDSGGSSGYAQHQH